MPMPTLAALTARLADYVEDDPTDVDVTDAAEEALEIVTDLVGSVEVSDALARRACLEVGAELYYRQQARAGRVTLTDGTIVPARPSKDPYAAGRAVLAPVLGPGIA